MSFRHEVTIPLSGFSMISVTGPNGHGKSSIILGVAWALFGQSRVDGDKDSIINDYEDFAEVTLDFEDQSGTSWRVHRVKWWQGTQELSIHHYDTDSGQWVATADHTIRENQQKVYEVCGLDEDSFYTLMAIEQNSIAGGTRFTAADSSSRRTILMSLLPELEIYGDLEYESSENHREIKADLDSAYSVSGVLKERVGDIKDTLDVRKSELQSIEDESSLRKTIKNNDKLIAQIDKLIDSENSGRADLSAQLDALRSERRAKNAELREKRSGLESELREINQKYAKIDSLNDEIAELTDNVEDFTEELENLDQKLSDLKDDIKFEEDVIERQETALSESTSKYHQLTALHESVKASVEALDIQHDHVGSGKCLVCDSQLSDDRVEELLLKANQELREVEDQLESATSSKNSAERKLDRSKSRLKSLEREISSSEREITRLEERQESTEGQLKLLRSELRRLRKEVKELRSESDIQKDIQSITEIQESDKERELKAELNEIDERSEHSDELRSLRSQNKAAQESIDRSINVKAVIESLEQDLKKSESDLEENTQLIKSLEDKVETAKVVREACSPKGIPSMLIGGVLEAIEDRQNSLLQKIMGDGAMSVEFRQERQLKSRDGSKSVLDIIVKTPDGYERPIESFSGGERVRLTMSNLIAMVQVFNERNPGMIRTLWLDEPFGALDTNSLPIMVEIISETVNQGIVDSVFVVTHQEEVSDALPQSMLVKKDLEHMTSIVEVV